MFHPQTHRQFGPENGISLLESLAAIAVMALGILGLLGIQIRTLSDMQTSIRRMQAIGLIEDFSERMYANPNARTNLSHYISPWTTPTTPVQTASKSCDAMACNAMELADFDIRTWKRMVQTSLPLGDAYLFRPATITPANDPRQLGILIRWRDNERFRTDAESDTSYLTYKAMVSTGGNGNHQGNNDISCPDGFTCHLQYLPVMGRCIPWTTSSSHQFLCPGD